MLFLAGGVAFSILLAGVPFFLLLSAGLGYFLGQDVDAASRAAQALLEGLIPASLSAPGESFLDPILADVVRTRAVAGFWGAIGFVWFSTRLFGALRSVMTTVFERKDRGFIHGKAWDVSLTLVAAALMTLWVVLSVKLAIGRGRVGTALVDAGMRADVMSGIEYWFGRLLAFGVIAATFFALYHLLPHKRPPWRAALAGGLAAALLFEVARFIFTGVIKAFPPSTIYTGTLASLVVLVFWTYYSALIFVLGAEVTHKTERTMAEHVPVPVA